MADKLTAAQLAEMGTRNIRVKMIRVCTIDNGSISATDISSRIKEWGSTKFEIYNKHPDDRGRLRFPIMNLLADNSDGYFDLGGTIFPNGRTDLAETTVRVQITADYEGAPDANLLDFTGQLREPEFDKSGTVTLVIEHPLTVLTGRKWSRQDRLGGDTGINYNFNT